MASTSIVSASTLPAIAGLSARLQSGATAGPSAVAALPVRNSQIRQQALRTSSFVSEKASVHFEGAGQRGAVRSAPSSAVTTTCQIAVGDAAPNFTLKDQNGRNVSLNKFRGRPVVLYFYPKDDTPGCTKQACSFRDSYTDFKKAGAEVVGISSDSVESHKEFAQKYNLPFNLLSDEDSALRKEFGIKGDFFGALPGRQTYVLDKAGTVRLVFNSQFSPEKHVAETIKVIEDIKAEQKGGLFAFFQ